MTHRSRFQMAWVVALIGALACIPKPPAKKPPPPDAKALFKDGQVQFNLGRFERALDSFTKAYEADPLPAFLFNIGQCHWSLERYERAVFFFEGYLREQPDAPNRKTVMEFISEAKARFNREKAAGSKEHDER